MADSRVDEAQFKEWVRGQQDVYRRVGWADWEDQATPAQWADAYATARGMRDVDPMAVHAANRIEQQYQERFGVNLREAHDLWQERAAAVSEELKAQQASTLDVAGLIKEHRPHYRMVSEESWRAKATQADWINAYGHVRVTAGLDPMAGQVMERIEQETRQRFNIDVKAAFDDELYRQADRLRDEADDLAAQSQEHQANANGYRQEAGGLDPDDPRVDDARTSATRDQAMADSDLHASEQAAHESVVIAEEVDEADEVARNAAPAFVPAQDAAEESHRARSRHATTSTVRRTRTQKRGKAR